MTNYIILLPPSEGKIENINKTTTYHDAKKNNSFPELSIKRNRVEKHLVEVLGDSDLKELQSILELKGVQLQKAIRANMNLDSAATLPAIYRYTGVMFKYINYQDMNQKQKDNFNSAVVFIDGLFGLLKPQDLIPDYKVKITTKLAGVNMTKYWKEELSGVWSELFSNKLIIDILPDSHRKVVDFSKTENHYEVVFYEEVDGKLKNAGHFSKKLKGELINYICSKDNISLEDLKDWNHSLGFNYSEEHSGEGRIVYLKK